MPTKGPEPVNRGKDPVSEMRIFRECVKKQKISEKISEDFKINQPGLVHFNTEKPNNNPYLLMKLRNEGKTINGVDYEQKLRQGSNKADLTMELSNKLKKVTHTPKDKWNVPQTSNQEIGWFADHKKNENPQFMHKRQGCQQTHYADGYYTMKHMSLFSKKSQK